jgi:fructose-1,6-bisphosphatase I
MSDTKAADRQTLSEYLTSAWKGSQEYDGLEAVVSAIANGGEQVHQKVQQAALADVLGGTGEINVHGEMVQRLDRAGTDIFVESLRRSGRVAAIGGEELEEPAIVGEDAHHAYMVLMDPLDGSSNIDVAVSIGSIFGIWPRRSGFPVTESSMLRPGNEQVAAAYVIYGSSTVMVIATRQGVDGFTLDPASGTFALTHPSMKIPEKCEYYSTNEGNFGRLDPATQEAVSSLRDAYSLRYVGSLVADFHRNLLKGGIFLYPGDSKSPDGKLRLMYEANPLGFIAVQAGGAASSGSRSILDIEPEALHQRTPLILGNRDVVEKAVATISRG